MSAMIYALLLSWGMLSKIFLNKLPEASINYLPKNSRNKAILGSSYGTFTLFKTNLKYICISKLTGLHSNILCDSAVTFTLTLILEAVCLQVSCISHGQCLVNLRTCYLNSTIPLIREIA